jgi:hypothetical protein
MDMGEKAADPIPVFCEIHEISRSQYYKERRAGRGPREMRIGRCVRITKEAQADYRREREAASNPPKQGWPSERSIGSRGHADSSTEHKTKINQE